MNKRVAFWLVLSFLIGTSAFAQVPYRLATVQSVADADRVRFKCAHTAAACAHDFIKALACELYKTDPRFGLNGKRGSLTDISYDALNFKGEGTDTDPDNPENPSGKATVIDVIGGAGGPSPVVAWFAVTDPNSPTKARWIKPCGSTTPTPVPPPPVVKPYPGDEFFVLNLGVLLEADYAEAGQTLNAGSVVWISRTIWRHVNEGMTIQESTAQSRKEWRAALGLINVHQ
jgi:hypothetical protein